MDLGLRAPMGPDGSKPMARAHVFRRMAQPRRPPDDEPIPRPSRGKVPWYGYQRHGDEEIEIPTMPWDVEALQEEAPYLFGDRDQDEIEAWGLFLKCAVPDIRERIAIISQDTSPRLPAKAALFLAHPALLRHLIGAIDAAGHHEWRPDLRQEPADEGLHPVAEKMEELVNALLEDARYGETRGQQVLAIRYRRPWLNPVVSIIGSSPLPLRQSVSWPEDVEPQITYHLTDSRKHRSDDTLIGAIRLLRLYSTLLGQMRAPLRSLDTERKRREAVRYLQEIAPELDLRSSIDVVGLTPAVAARRILRVRLKLEIDDITLQARITRAVKLMNRSLGESNWHYR